MTVLSLFFVAASSQAADPVYLDELMETPLAKLQTIFPDLRKDGCYQIAEDRFVLVEIDKKDAKPWRVVLASAPPCKRAEPGPAIDVRERAGVELGQTQVSVVQRMGHPTIAQDAEREMKRFGNAEYFYMCRVSPECARHTSVFLRDGIVSAIAEWYSQ
jgi:hypothetical protein